MSIKLPEPPLLFITDRHLAAGPLVATVAAAFDAGLRWVSLREKDLDAHARAELARELVILGRRFGATVTVHADLRAVQEAGAAGIHLPSWGNADHAREMLGPTALIGMSAHDLEQVKWACEHKVDYVTLSPVFRSISKPGHCSPECLSHLTEMASTVSTPILALGGITPDRVDTCIATGARGVAVVGAIVTAPDPASVTREFLCALSAASANKDNNK